MSGARAEMKWLRDNQRTLSSNGWDSLLSGNDMVLKTKHDNNHLE